jgi:poly-beta-1,6-N-acetyl-D-glucosamine synthase
MTIPEIFFWSCLLLAFYTYLGYGIILWLLVKIKNLLGLRHPEADPEFVPSVTLVIPAFNEADFILIKAQNCLELDYPKDKFRILFITDGSNDGTEKKLEGINGVEVSHSEIRGGKSAAENRAIGLVNSEIVVFCDANTLLNQAAIRKLAAHFADPQVGAVSGEKRIFQDAQADTAGAGEGLYWKYESTLKRLDAELYSIVGAASELIAFRTQLFQPLETDTILDDFVQSMRICLQGYRVAYEPGAYAMETASASVSEELKRKIRIAAGGWQAMSRLPGALFYIRRPQLSFAYISHRVLRWSITPLALLLLIPLNLWLLTTDQLIYQLLLAGQCLFYAGVWQGYQMEKTGKKSKFFIPYYFFVMNYAVLAGFGRFVKGSQSAKWERAKRG